MSFPTTKFGFWVFDFEGLKILASRTVEIWERMSFSTIGKGFIMVGGRFSKKFGRVGNRTG